MTSPRLVIGAIVLVAAACGSGNRAVSGPAGLPPLADAPYELASDRDLEDVRDRYEAMDPGDPERDRVRAELAREYARRMNLALRRPEAREDAHEMLLELASLWRTDELSRASAGELGAALGRYADPARALRDRFARAGLDVQTTAALLFLALADPAGKEGYLAEIDEIFAYADDLSRAQFGDGAEGARPIEILEAIVHDAPMPEAVDRLIDRYLSRQKAFHDHFRQHGPNALLIRAHGESVFKTAWHVVRVLARAGRLDQAEQRIAGIEGLGANRSLSDIVQSALAANARPQAWLELASAYDDIKPNDEGDQTKAKLRAVLAISREGAGRFAGDADLPRRAADAARRLDLLHVAIRFYEQAWARQPDSRDTAEALAELYRVRVSTLAFYERPLAAQKRLAELEAFHAQVARRWPKQPLESDLADAYAAMGRGMISLGEIERARQYLQKSLALRPTQGALEQLGTIALKRDRFAEAIAHFDRALELPAKEPLEQYNRAKILRLAGDALHGAGMKDRATRRFTEAIDTWMELGNKLELPPAYKGELLVESGKAQWALGDPETAMLAFDTAVDVDSGGADTHSSVVAFLIVRGEYDRALDTFHRALGSHEVEDYSKVYLSLWMLAEARRSGRRPDPLALEYLRGRKSRLWHDALARFATGKTDLDTLRSRVKTRGQSAELLYYSAVLGGAGRSPDPSNHRSGDESSDKSGDTSGDKTSDTSSHTSSDKAGDIRAMLERVVATDMMLFYEYDFAKHWLAEGFAPAVRTSR